MFERVLVATDGSAHSGRAVEVAADIAARFGAELKVVHVVLTGPIPPQLAHMAEVEHLVAPDAGRSRHVEDVPGALTAMNAAGETREHRERMRYAVAEQVLSAAEHAARAKSVRAVTSEMLEGDSAEAILGCAERMDADLVVMGSRGLSELKGLLLGSVSHKVCQLSKCSCVTVK